MGLFDNKNKGSASEATQLIKPATIIVASNSIPSHSKATYWFEVSLNDEIVGKIEQNGVPSKFTTMTDRNVLRLILVTKLSNGNITRYPSPKQKLELKDGEIVNVLFENRRFTVN